MIFACNQRNAHKGLQFQFLDTRLIAKVTVIQRIRNGHSLSVFNRALNRGHTQPEFLRLQLFSGYVNGTHHLHRAFLVFHHQETTLCLSELHERVDDLI